MGETAGNLPAGNTLVLNAMPGLLTDAAVARCAALFGAGTAQGRWLAPREAWELDLGPVFDATGIAAVRAALDDAPVDANIVRFAPGERRKRLLVADMDSTMIGQECIDELAGYVGLKTHVTEITERAMRGEIAFEPALRERVALLKGLDASVIEDVLRERITLMPGGRALVATMRANGATACLVSGGFTGFVDRIASELGFDGSRANVLEIADGRLTGAVREPILGREAKLAALVALRNERGLTAGGTLAVGDGANDLAMLGEAGLGVAFHAKPAVAAAAAARIDHGDLTALLYLQGYARADFVGKA